MVSKVREKILVRKVRKIQNVVKKYLLDKRLEKIKEQATKLVNRLHSVIKMKKQRALYLAIRQKIIKVQANIRFFLSMAKYFREKNCRDVAYILLDKAWGVIMNHKAILIQKAWKGFSVRQKYKRVFEGIRRKLRLAKYRDHLIRALFSYKYRKFQDLMRKYLKPVVRLQAIARGRYARKAFKLLRKSAIIIQKAYRTHLRKKYYLTRLWKSYRLNLYSEEQLRGD
jgi:hypothetical protein